MSMDSSAGDTPPEQGFGGRQQRPQNLELGIKNYTSGILQAFAGTVAGVQPMMSGCDAPLVEVFDGLERRTQGLEQGMKKYASAITSAFASAVTSGKSFDDVLKSLALRMSQMAVQAALRPLVGGLMGGLNNIFAGIFTGGGKVAAPNYMPPPDGPAAGAVALPPTSLAGLAPTAGAGAVSPHVSIHISTPDAESFRRSEAYVTGQIARAVARGQRTL